MLLRILVLGAGATGGYFGGRLVEAASAGEADVDVTFLVRPARARALAAHGLTIVGPPGEMRLPVRARVAGELEGDYDLVLLSCKAYDLDSAMESIAPAVGERTLILPILNGLLHFDRLDERFGAARVLGGCCHLAAMLDRDGVIRQLGPIQGITYGERPQNLQHAGDVLARLHAAYKQINVNARLSTAVMQDIWEKYVFLAGLAALTCVMRAAVGDIVATDDGEAIALRVLAECEAAAAHAGHPSRPEVLESTRASLTMKGSRSTASMLRDLEAGARIESVQIVGDMLRRARAAGSDASVLQLAWAHLQARDLRLARERGGA
jgi:2-dehydropantoate 2-reductase